MDVRALQESMNKCRIESEDEENEVDRFAFVPDDILLDILKRLPDAFLRYKAKYVCKRWFIVSTNMILLDHASFILQKSSGIHTVRVVGIREEPQGLEVKEQNLDITFSGRIKSWYNEFLLISDPSRGRSLHVFNLITKEFSFLPPCHTQCEPHYNHRCVVAFLFKEVYKVVHLFMGPPFQCHILSLGSNIASGVSSNWKKMEIGWDWDDEDWQYHWDIPNHLVSVQVQGRYFHWDVGSYNFLVSVDMVKEEIFQMSLPGSNDHMVSLFSIFEMGGFLALMDGVSRGKADIWILKDFHMMTWKKLQSMTVPDYYIETYPVSCFLYPICGVISKRYIVFMKRRSRLCCIYDLQNGVVTELNFHILFGEHYVVRSSTPNFM